MVTWARHFFTLYVAISGTHMELNSIFFKFVCASAGKLYLILFKQEEKESIFDVKLYLHMDLLSHHMTDTT